MLYVLWILAGVLLLLWMFGVAGALSFGGGVHALLIVAILAIVATLFTRPRLV